MANYLRAKKVNGRVSYYYSDFYDPRRGRKKVSLQTKDKGAAMQRFVKLERMYLAGDFDPWADPVEQEGVTLRDAVERFIRDRAEHTSKVNAATYGYILRPFVRTVAVSLPLYGVRREQIARYLKSLDIAESSRRSYRDRMRIFFAWCKSKGYVKENPVPEPSRGKAARQKAVPRFFTEEQFDRLIRVVEADASLNPSVRGGNRYLLDVLHFAVGTGLRLAEICNLQWSALNLSSGVLTVANTEEFTTKSGRERSVPLVGGARTIIDHLAAERLDEADAYVFRGEQGGKLNGQHLSRVMRKYRALAKLPSELHFHSLRHTFASWFVQRGGDLYQLRGILGHADVKMTQVYAHLLPEGARRDMERAFGGIPTPSVAEEVARLQALLLEREAELFNLRVDALVESPREALRAP